MIEFDDQHLDDAFQAHHLAIPMRSAFALAPKQSIDDARQLLTEGRFDQAPVIDGDEALGFVLTRELVAGDRRPIADVMTRLGSGNVVSADASVGRLLEWIIDPGFLFVLEGRDVTGFITVSDFNKQPARGYVYLLLARLEIGLAELLRRRFGHDQSAALALLSEPSQATITSHYQDDRSAGEEGEYVAYFDFSDLLTVVAQDDTLRSWICGWSRRTWKKRTGGLVALRNNVMHPVRNIVLAKGGLVRLREREQRIRDLVARVDHAVAGAG